MKKAFFLSTVALLSLGALSGCGSDDGKTIKVWCDELVVETTTEILDAYKAAHSDFDYKFKIEPVGEGSAAGNMITDPSAGADVYFFAQDQLARLVTAKAISQLPEAAKTTVTADNDAVSVAAATTSGNVYAYPVTSDNTFFLYYDTSVLSANDVKDLDTIVAKCKAANKYFYMDLGNAWYNASFFYAVGAQSEWTTDVKGNFTAYNDTYKSKGIEAMKEMNKLQAEATAFKSAGDGAAAFKSSTAPAAAVVSGTWDKGTAKEALGDKMGVAVLPGWKGSDNKTYTLKPFTGCKLVGTKPQTTTERAQAVVDVALALSNKDAQLKRFEKLGWGPSNKAAQKDSKVTSDAVAVTVAAQMAAGTPQGQYPGSWWDLAKALGVGLGKKTDAELNTMLSDYDGGLEALLS